MAARSGTRAFTPAALIVVNPSGVQTRVALAPMPFRIGRQGDNHLVLRDNRASRNHAQIVLDGNEYWIEDLESRHGVYVNGARIERRQRLQESDRVDFGFSDSYRLTFTLDAAGGSGLLEHTSAGDTPGAANLAKLRAILEVARALQASHSIDDVLAAVIEAALAVTGCERGFLLLRSGEDLEVRVARDRSGPLPATDLRVPTRLILRALRQRRDFLSMNFDANGEMGPGPEHTVAELELRSVVAVPLVRVRAGALQETAMLAALDETVGILYMDSRAGVADLAAGGRELLQTLALEASTVLENARLLEEEWIKQRMEEELNIARQIQRSLLPRRLPESGWFRAAASSLPSREVGGDYLDVWQPGPDCWAAVVADVSGKGVSSALLASFLQGAFLAAGTDRTDMEQCLARISRFLQERTEGEKYATLFYCALHSSGLLRYINAGHCPPLLVRGGGAVETLAATAMPVGIIDDAAFAAAEARLAPGDCVIVYSDGISDAQSLRGENFGAKRIHDIARRESGCTALHTALRRELDAFTAGVPQHDDVTLLVFEFRPGTPRS